MASSRAPSDKRILSIGVALLYTLAVLHVLAERNAWYWTYRWFDVPMHILGGAWAGLVVLWAFLYTQRGRAMLPETAPRRALGPRGFAFLLLFFLAWEAYEFGMAHITGVPLPRNWAGDTALDILSGMAGGALALWGYPRLFPAEVAAAFSPSANEEV